LEDHRMPMSIYLDEQQLLLNVLSKALGEFKNSFGEVHGAAIAANKKNNGVLLHDALMLSLYRAFSAAYQNDPRLPRPTVFAKPLKSISALTGVRSPYNRGEYGFDFAVIEMRTEAAPYYKVNGEPSQVNVVVRHLWQVESEIRNDATILSEDLGKLAGGAAPCKLLVTLIPQQQDDGNAWKVFIEKVALCVSGQLYVAMVRSYAGKNGRRAWVDGTPEMRAYRMTGGQLIRIR
jgi:hypothetical protein